MLFAFVFKGLAQEKEAVELPEYSKYKDLGTKTWINTYGNIRIGTFTLNILMFD